MTRKPVSAGSLMRGPSPPSGSMTANVHGYIIEAHWDSFQPTTGGPLVTSAIDAAVSAAQQFNKANPSNPQSLRMRVEAGIHAPGWVKAMDGGAVSVSGPSPSLVGTVPRWWFPDVQAAYADFVGKLAAYIDPIPEIRECTVGLTMLFFGEVFIRFPTQNATALKAAGFTQALDLAAMQAMMDAHKAFQSTITILDCNAYQQLIGGGSLTVTQQVMNYSVAALPGLEFTNASLTDAGNASLYALMESYGPKGNGQAALSFQTMPTVGSLANVLQRAVDYGATSCELPAAATAAEIAPFDAKFKANAGPPQPWPWR